MTNKPVLTDEQFAAKVDEFNSIPQDDRICGMRLGLDCEHTRELINYSWDFAKKTAEENGHKDIEHIYMSFHTSVIKTILQGIGAPEAVIATLGNMLSKNAIMNGLLWHTFIEVAPEEDVVLLTGNFDVYSEVSNG